MKIKSFALGFRSAGILLMFIIAKLMIHLFMLQHLYFIQTIVQSISKLIGEQVGKSLQSTRLRNFGKPTERRLLIQ